MIAADFANFARVPTDADIDALKALGVTRVIIGSSFGTKAAQQIAACRPHFEVQEFQFPEALKPHVGDWWIDVEITDFHIPTQTEVRAACQQQPIGVYSSKSQWDALWPGWDIVAEFPFLKLWTANYGPLPRPFTPYGGWAAPAMTQHQDTTDIGTGFEVDLSEYEEDEMTPEQEARLAAAEKATEQLKLYAWNHAVRLNAAEVHKHTVIASATSGPVAP